MINTRRNMKRRDPNSVIRPGDRVKVVNPLVFVRVGYPFDIDYAIENLITKEEKQKIDGLVGYYDYSVFRSPSVKESYCRDKIFKIFAYYKLVGAGFGGNKREIHTKEERSLAGQEFNVFSKRYVVTGEREPGYYDGNEGQPPTLNNTKRHVILDLGSFEIQAENVIKL